MRLEFERAGLLKNPALGISEPAKTFAPRLKRIEPQTRCGNGCAMIYRMHLRRVRSLLKSFCNLSADNGSFFRFNQKYN